MVRALPLPAFVPPIDPGDREVQRREPVRRAPVSREPLPLPLPAAPPPARRDVVFGMCAVDDKGRISDVRVMAALGWAPGQRVTFSFVHGVIVVVADDAGGQSVCGRGCLRLPTGMRRAVAIGRGERVLLAALIDAGRLVVHPLVHLDGWSVPVHSVVLGGDR